MLPTPEQRNIAVDAVRQILMLVPEDLRMERPLVQKLSEVLEMDLREMSELKGATSA
jgi:hypothetical protein